MALKNRTRNSSDRRLRLMVGAQFVWLVMVFVLGAWWGSLVLTQAAHIVELETSLGMSSSVTQMHWHKTQRMLYGESAVFFGLLLACTAFLFWLYWRDVKRARGIQAFFASVTHELRTPLTSIRLQAESIAETLGCKRVKSSVQHNINRLLEDSMRLEAQVERTLELARIEGGGPVYIQSTLVKPWLERLLNHWKVVYSDQVEFESQIEDLMIQADLSAVEVIFRNLLENAIRHSHRDQVVISIVTQHRDHQVMVCLKDNGVGYSGDWSSLGKIFQKGPLSQGTGVGLYLVKVLMTRMGGWADFLPDPKNSGFQVTLCFQAGQELTIERIHASA